MTPREITSWLKALEKERTLWGQKKFKISMEIHTFSVQSKHNDDPDYSGSNATVHGHFYLTNASTKVDLVTKPSTLAIVIGSVVSIVVPILILCFPELIDSAENIVTNDFSRAVLTCLFLLIMVPINYLLIILPMHQMRYFVEDNLGLTETK